MEAAFRDHSYTNYFYPDGGNFKIEVCPNTYFSTISTSLESTVRKAMKWRYKIFLFYVFSCSTILFLYFSLFYFAFLFVNE